jgi:hypothetical protein
MPTECERVATVRTPHSKPAVQRLHSVATGDECATSQRRGENKDKRALELKLRADPVRGVKNEGEQWDSDTEERDEKHPCPIVSISL